MALIRCSECGHEVSDKAKACPKCGNKMAASRDKGNNTIKIVGAVAVVALLIGGAFLFLNKGDEAIKQKFVRFEDVYVDLSDIDKKHINTNLLEILKSRGYELQKEEKTSDYNELYDQTINMTHYYLGLNMSYNGYWKATGSPCSGVEFFVSDEPHASAVIHFESGSDLAAFLTDAEKAEFRKKDNNEWSRNSDYPYDFISKKDDTTLECNSEFPF